MFNKIYQSFVKFWLCLTSVGMEGVADDREAKYIQFTNVVTSLSAIAVFSYIPFSLAMGSYFLSVLQAVDAICLLVVLWLNHQHYHRAARLAYLLIVNIFVLVNSCLIGYESRVHDFFYISYITPFLLFSVKDYKNIIIGVCIAIFFFYVYENVHGYFISYNLDSTSQHVVYQINLWMKFVLFGVAIYILSYYNYSAEKQLEQTNLKLQSQAIDLKRSNEDLEQFAGIISHDLKAPVSNIGSFMQLLQNRYGQQMDTAALELVALSYTSANRMSRQIEDLLSYSKLGRNLPTAVSVDLNQVIKSIQIELNERIKQCNATVVMDKPLPILHQSHSSMLHHVFQNLISNGIKFNKNPSPKVTISFENDKGNYLFMVKDNGIGIESKYKNKLFHMFMRLHTQEAFEGTGIGLAVCKKIIEFYGGAIWFESETDSGTCFYFRLPIHSPAPSQNYKAIYIEPQGVGVISYS